MRPKSLYIKSVNLFHIIGQMLLWMLVKLSFRLFLRINVNKNVELQDNGKPIIFISNHISLFDPFLIYYVLSWREVRTIMPIKAMLAKWYYHSPIWPLAFLVGCFPARPLLPSRKKHAGTRGAVKYINRGCSMAMFPEGTRLPDGRQPAKYGIIKILSMLDEKPDIYICKIVKTKRAHYSITFTKDNTLANVKDPDRIMDRIYALK